jgi:hypothetical protein
MEINLNNNGLGGIGIGRETLGVRLTSAKPETTDASRVSDNASLRISDSSSRAQPTALASSEPVADVPDAALSRDDELGKLVNAAFSLPAPPMPAFD